MVVWLAFDFVCVYAITYYNRHGSLYRGTVQRIVILPNRISLVVLCYSFTKKFTVALSFSRRHFLVSIIFRVPFVLFVGVLIEIDAGRSVLSFEKV